MLEARCVFTVEGIMGLAELWHNILTRVTKLCQYNSNKSPTRCNNFSSLLSWRLFTAQHVSGVLTPIIRSWTTAVAASGFTFGA